MWTSLIINPIFIIIIVIILCIISCIVSYYNKKDKFFYKPGEISYDLKKIHGKKIEIYNEITDVYFSSRNWVDWPEKELYGNDVSWEIFPFYGFGKWIKDNCRQCPKLYDFLKSLNGLKFASLSKLSAGMKIKHHKGIGIHSNNIIRCHYGLIVPTGSYISVSNTDTPPLYRQSKKNKYPDNIYYNKNKKKEEIQFYKQYEWTIFDNSKTHYEENTSDKDIVILIIDIERPKNINFGKSFVKDNDKLKELIDYYFTTFVPKVNNINKSIDIDDINKNLLDNEIENPNGISKYLVNKILYGS